MLLVVVGAVCFNAGAWIMFGSWHEEDQVKVIPWKKGVK